MALTFVEIVTASDLTLSGGTATRKLTIATGADTSFNSAPANGGGTETHFFVTEPDVPNHDDWTDSGVHTVEVEIDLGDADIDCDVRVGRCNSSGTILQTGSFVGALALDVTRSFSPVAPAWTSGEEACGNRLFYELLITNNAAHGSHTVDIGLGTTANECTDPDITQDGGSCGASICRLIGLDVDATYTETIARLIGLDLDLEYATGPARLIGLDLDLTYTETIARLIGLDLDLTYTETLARLIGLDLDVEYATGPARLIGLDLDLTYTETSVARLIGLDLDLTYTETIARLIGLDVDATYTETVARLIGLDLDVEYATGPARLIGLDLDATYTETLARLIGLDLDATYSETLARLIGLDVDLTYTETLARLIGLDLDVTYAETLARLIGLDLDATYTELVGSIARLIGLDLDIVYSAFVIAALGELSLEERRELLAAWIIGKGYPVLIMPREMYFVVGELPPPTTVRYEDENKVLITSIAGSTLTAKTSINGAANVDVGCTNNDDGTFTIDWPTPSLFAAAGSLAIRIWRDDGAGVEHYLGQRGNVPIEAA